MPLPPGAVPLPLTRLEQSVPDLLGQGYDLVSVTMGLAGPTYILRRGPVWIMCAVGAYGDASAPRLYTTCDRLGR